MGRNSALKSPLLINCRKDQLSVVLGTQMVDGGVIHVARVTDLRMSGQILGKGRSVIFFG